MTLEQLIKKLNFKQHGEYNKNKYVITLDNSDEFAAAFTVLDDSGLELDTDAVLISDHGNMFIYRLEDFVVKLIGNFDNDDYRVEIGKEE